MKPERKWYKGEQVLFEKGGYQTDPNPPQISTPVKIVVNTVFMACFLALIILDDLTTQLAWICGGILAGYAIWNIWRSLIRKVWIDNLILTNKRIILPYKEIPLADISQTQQGFDMNGVPSTDVVTRDGETTTLPAIEVDKVRQLILELSLIHI